MPLAKFHDWHPLAPLHAARHAAEDSIDVGAPSCVPLRIMSGSMAVGKFMRKVTSFPPAAASEGAETASVNDAMGRADASMSLILYLQSHKGTE